MAMIVFWGVLWLVGLLTGDMSAVQNRKTIPWLAPAFASAMIFGSLTRKARRPE